MPTIRIDYHEANRLPLLTGPVRQCAEHIRMKDSDAQIYIRTGWLNGPHLELCIVSATETDLTPQLQLIREWMKEHPSKARIAADEYEALSRKLGALEGMSEPFAQLRPDNTVELIEYREFRLVDGHQALQPAYIRFFNRTADLLFQMASLKLENPSEATLSLIGMLAIAAEEFESEGIARGYLSLRAHADFFFANYDTQGIYRGHYDRLAQSWKKQLALAVKGVPQEAFHDLAIRDAVAAMMREWKGILARTKQDIHSVIAQDKSWFYYNPMAFHSEMSEEHLEAFAKAGIAPRKIEAGAMLDSILDSAKDEAFFQSEEFQTFRVTLNLFYSLLRTLHVSPAERFGMCHLVADTYCSLRDAGAWTRDADAAVPHPNENPHWNLGAI